MEHQRHRGVGIVMDLLVKKSDIRVLLNLTKHQIKDRYMGSFIGFAWAILQPLSFLLIYTFVFTFVLKSRLPGSNSSLAFSIWLLTGMVPWLFISEATSNGANILITFSAIIKNMIFKIELLPVVAVLLSFIQFTVGFTFLIILLTISGNYPTWHYIFIPLIVSIQFLFFVGLSLFIAPLTVFIRDMIQIIPTSLQLILFASPVFYAVSAMPKWMQIITFFNPVYQLVNPYRAVMIEHTVPDIAGLLYITVVTFILLVVGSKFFRRLKGFFNVVL